MPIPKRHNKQAKARAGMFNPFVKLDPTQVIDRRNPKPKATKKRMGPRSGL